MPLMSNISALSHPLFRGITKRVRSAAAAVSKPKKPLMGFLDEEEHLFTAADRELQKRIQKDIRMMKRQGIPVDDYEF